jgi:hypothetical protein
MHLQNPMVGLPALLLFYYLRSISITTTLLPRGIYDIAPTSYRILPFVAFGTFSLRRRFSSRSI